MKNIYVQYKYSIKTYERTILQNYNNNNNNVFLFSAAKAEMIKSKLPNNVLGKVWKLSDVDKDGMLDSDEFALAMHLISIKMDGHDLPGELPTHLVPPSKRGF